MKLKMVSAAALTTTTKKTSSRLPISSLVLAATVVMVLAAIGGLLALALSMATIGSSFSSSILSENRVLAISTLSSSSLVKGIGDPDQIGDPNAIGDPNETVLIR